MQESVRKNGRVRKWNTGIKCSLLVINIRYLCDKSVLRFCFFDLYRISSLMITKLFLIYNLTEIFCNYLSLSLSLSFSLEDINICFLIKFTVRNSRASKVYHSSILKLQKLLDKTVQITKTDIIQQLYLSKHYQSQLHCRNVKRCNVFLDLSLPLNDPSCNLNFIIQH